MAWCERNCIGYIFGLAGNPVLLRQISPLAEDAALGRLAGEGEKVRRYGDFRYAAKSWTVERRVIARVEAGPQGVDTRFVVTSLAGVSGRTVYQDIYCPSAGHSIRLRRTEPSPAPPVARPRTTSRPGRPISPPTARRADGPPPTRRACSRTSAPTG